MVDYYRYLWSTTWPNVMVLFLILGIVFSRLGWKIMNTWRYAHNTRGFLLLTGKVLIWLGILAIYVELFFLSQPDWLAQPGFIQGSVQEKAFDSSSRSYVLDVRSGSEQKQFYVDQNVYGRIKVEDQVRLMYLPDRREVVNCELLGRLL